MYENIGELLTFDGVQDPSTLIPHENRFKFLSAKRSIRGFEKKKVPKKIILKILKSMKYAPTGGNIRTLQCTIISDDEKISKLSEVIMDAIIDSGIPEYSEDFIESKKNKTDRIFFNAPHVMIMHSIEPGNAMNSTITLTYGMLYAQTLGLGSCWIGLAQGILNSSKEIREKIAGIDRNVWGVIIFGYSIQTYYKVPPRPDIITKGLDELE